MILLSISKLRRGLKLELNNSKMNKGYTWHPMF